MLDGPGVPFHLGSVDTEAYLARINYRGPRSATTETLHALHHAHMLAVPFENLSIHRSEPIILDDDALFDKIVRRRRGGFCYELNGLFAALLRALGFQVQRLSAGVHGARGFGPDFDHMALLVLLEQRWLADVGFGDGFREPLLLDARTEQIQGEEAYRIDAAGERRVLMRRDRAGEWQPQYRFGLEPYDYAAFDEMCHYHQTSPLSDFTQKRVCSLATPGGRVTISAERLIISHGRERTERVLGEHELARALRDYFGIELQEA